MRFLYLIQSRESKPYQDRQHCLYLTFGKEVEGAIYFPKSTWTTGRNKLYEIAREMAANGDVYDYYVFCDDDVVWKYGSWDELETRVMIDKPQVATPTMIGYPYSSIGRIFMYDACINVFSKKILMETNLLPYSDEFDSKSWWFSQLVLIYRTLYMVSDDDIKWYSHLIYSNIGHSEYPKSLHFDEAIPFLIEKYDIENKYKSLGYNFVNLKNDTIENSLKINVVKHAIILTTINSPTKCVHRIIEWCKEHSNKTEKWELIIVADKKTPVDDYIPLKCKVLTCDIQNKLYPVLSEALPWNHYSRKNIGYVYAIQNGYKYIAETDDDNYFTEKWKICDLKSIPSVISSTSDTWVNIFREYTQQTIWPRGLPFEHKHNVPQHTDASVSTANVAVYQGLVDGEPDYDAVYRLSRSSDDLFTFDDVNGPVAINKNIMCPFNSQNTIWMSCYRYMYLPCTVSFRYTDILRSYVANFGFWKDDKYLAYTPATAIQERNDHNLVKDLEDELPMYKTWHTVAEIGKNLGDNMDLCNFYQELYKVGIVSEKELNIIQIWLTEIQKRV